jgi:hypothetical protein
MSLEFSPNCIALSKLNPIFESKAVGNHNSATSAKELTYPKM